MFKRICLMVVLVLGLGMQPVHAAQTIKILVFPFEIHAPQNLDYLKNQIPEAVGRNLEKDGASLIKPEIQAEAADALKANDISRLQQIGLNAGADYIIWGSMTWLVQNFSIDSRMVDTTGGKFPAVFFSEGEGIENLAPAIKKITNEMGLRLFKRDKIADITIVGNRRIEADAILRTIKTQPGDIYMAQNLSNDLKAIYGMGYFEDVRIEAEDTTGGKRIIFKVREKPTIRLISFSGNQVFENDKLLENMDIKTGSILNIFKVQSNINRILNLYKEKNYHNVKVTYAIKTLDNNQGDLEFVIDEGEKIKIKEIRFEGNAAFPAKKLKGVMKTDEKGFWSWLTSSGELNREDLNQDAELLAAFYHNNGYIQARVGEPVVDFSNEWIYVTIKIDEGARFKVGNVRVSGDLLTSEAELLALLKISKESFYNREVMRNDVLALNDYYADEGYAYADVMPKIDQNAKDLLVDIDYVITRGSQVYFERIQISGNTKTRDKVIRRELQSYEQELFSGKKLKRGIRNLYRLDYFEDIKVNTVKGSEPDKMILDIVVKEKQTGTFTIGGGYSSIENVFFVGAVTQRNLFGRGQILQFKGEIGGTTTRYNLGFTEPWLFDIPLSAGVDLYDQERDYDTYDLDTTGAALRFGYPVWDYTRAYATYTLEQNDMYDLDDDLSNYFKAMEGENITSSITPSLRYDSRDRVFNPTEGANHALSVEYAGDFLGGDIGFTKYIAETGWYFPLFWGTVGFAHAKAGLLDQHPDELLPPYERFYLGGINSLRGFDWQELSPVDENGDYIGGDKYVQMNLECIFPLLKDAGLMGVVFYDTGNVYNDDEEIALDNLRQSAGFGIRWYSPMGPIRLENGFILDPKENESKSGKWEFTMGSAF